MPKADTELVKMVIQRHEIGVQMTAEERIMSASEFNIMPKGRRMLVKTIAEVCENVSGRITKEPVLWIKTKEPVYVLITGDKIPLDEIKKLRRRNDDQTDESTLNKDGACEIHVTDNGAK